MQKIVISVSKSYIHRGRRLRHRQSTKKKWHLYYYELDTSDGRYKLKTKRINWFQALYYITQKRRRYKYYCTDCGSAVIALLKSRKSTLECPFCDTR
jgi:hypothetical protein